MVMGFPGCTRVCLQREGHLLVGHTTFGRDRPTPTVTDQPRGAERALADNTFGSLRCTSERIRTLTLNNPMSA
jgi:hypothetical protein